MRFVDKDGNIKEHFICFEELSGAFDDNYFDVLKKCMGNCGLDFSMCRGQAYDGANTISGQYAGLQSKVKDLSPFALYIHCCAYNINLVLIDSITSSIDAVSFFWYIRNIIYISNW